MFIRVVYYGKNKTAHYYSDDGTETLYIGGFIPWRLNNPGNLTRPGKNKIPGIIGYAETKNNTFCIFPDPKAGWAALRQVLQTQYSDRSLLQTMYSFAPPSQNDTAGYIDFLEKYTGVSKDAKIGLLDGAQLSSLMEAIARKEGFYNGKGVVKHIGRPKTVAASDSANNPLVNQPISIKGGDVHVQMRTNENGELPKIYPDLIGDELLFYYKKSKDELEKMGRMISSSSSFIYRFIAPYYAVSTRAQAHKPERPVRPRIHIVRPGETLSGIAKKYGTTVEAISSESALKNPDQIYARQHLKIPRVVAASTSSSVSAAGAANHPPTSIVAAAAQGGLVAATSASQSSGANGDGASAQSTPPPVAGLGQQQSQSGQGSSASTNLGEAANTGAGASQPTASGNGTSSIQQQSQSGHPQTVLSSATRELSGHAWCERFPGSRSVDALVEPFKSNVNAFVDAIRTAGLHYTINATYRPIQRSYCMYYAFKIAKGSISPDAVEPWDGVDIEWVHRNADGQMDLAVSKRAAREMCMGYGLNLTSASQLVGYPGLSRHNHRRAIDIIITDYLGKTIENAHGVNVLLNSKNDLVEVGRSFRVLYFHIEKMHWSDTGN